MNPEQRIKLNELISANKSVDNTKMIRELKHSSLIRKDVHTIQQLKNECKDHAELDRRASIECHFLFSTYTMIYNRLIRDQIDVMVLMTFLNCLKKIEDGELDQHDASFEIGTLLKRMYVDPIVEKEKEPEYKKGKNLTWQEYKNKRQ